MNDLLTLVGSAVMCKFNMECLLQRLLSKQQTLTAVTNVLGNTARIAGAPAAVAIQGIRNNMMQQIILTRRLIGHIRSNILVQLDEIVKNNVHILPEYFASNRNADK